MIITRILAGTLCVASLASQALAQPIDPFPKPIPATEGAIKVSFTEFASLPDIDGEAARMMLLIDEPGTRRLFVNDMRGILYSVSYDGKSVAPYLDLRIPRWSLDVLSVNFEQGIQSFAFHPQFATPRRPWLRQVLYVRRHQQHRASPRLQDERSAALARYDPARMDREGSGGRRIRRRAAS